MNQSYWQKTTRKQKEKPLQQDISVDVAIIGGGLAGVSLAYALKDTALSVAVLEKDALGSHTTAHTTAKVTALHGLNYQQMIKHYDIHKAYLYYQSNSKAIQEIKEIIQKENIECEWKDNISYIYTDDPQSVQDIQQQKEFFDSIRVEYVEDHQHLASLGLKEQAIFHPLKYLYGLIDACKKSNIQFYEESEVIHIERKDSSFLLEANGYHIECRYLVHATRYPFIRKGIYFMKLFQQREFVDYKDSQDHDNSYLCIDQTKSYRPVDQGSLHVTSDADDWYTQDTMTLRGIPYIGKLSRYDEEYIIYGFQKWGMSLSRVAAKLISDLILEKENPYEELYSCHYFSMSNASQYTQTIMNNVKRGYWSHRFQTVPLQTLDYNDGGLVKEEGHIYAVYRDEKGEFHYFSPYCPHLKCMVNFNKKTKTWDCPCHQSVYNAYGEVIEGPTLYSLRKKA